MTKSHFFYSMRQTGPYSLLEYVKLNLIPQIWTYETILNYF